MKGIAGVWVLKSLEPEQDSKAQAHRAKSSPASSFEMQMPTATTGLGLKIPQSE